MYNSAGYNNMNCKRIMLRQVVNDLGSSTYKIAMSYPLENFAFNFCCSKSVVRYIACKNCVGPMIWLNLVLTSERLIKANCNRPKSLSVKLCCACTVAS